MIAASCPIVINWDYLNTVSAWGLPGSTRTGRSSTRPACRSAASTTRRSAKYAPHPAAARLWEEFLYSTTGQNIWLKGGARPVELAAMVKAKTDEQGGVQRAAEGHEPRQGSGPDDVAGHSREHVLTSNWLVADRHDRTQLS